MLGKPSKRARRHLEETGRRAPAQILDVAERGMAITSGPEGLVSSTEVLLKTTLRVEPPGEPAFEVSKRIRYPQLSTPVAGMRVNVIYDPDDHDELMLDDAASVGPVKDIGSLLGAVQAAQQESGGDPQALAAALRESLGANAVSTSAGAFAEPDDKLDRLEKLGHLRDQGILTEDEFQTEKQKILAGP